MLKLDKDPVTTVLFILILIVSFCLRLYNLDTFSLWADEMSTISRAKQSIFWIFQFHKVNAIPYTIVHFTLYFGKSDFIVRFPSVIFGVLSILPIYLIGKELFEKKVGLISAFLLSISPFHIYYSQEVRYYSYFTFFSLLTMFFLWKSIKEKDKKVWIIGLIVSTLLNLFTHHFALFVLIIEISFITFLILKNYKLIKSWIVNRYQYHKKNSKDLLLILIIGLIIVLILNHISSLQLTEQINPEGSLKTTSETIKFSLQFFIDIFGGYFGAGKSAANTVTQYIFILFFVLGIFSSQKKYTKPIIYSIFWITIPFVILFTVKMKHFFDPKYIIFILPVYLIVISKGINYSANILTQIISYITKRKHKLVLVNSIIIIILLFFLISSIPYMEYIYKGHRLDIAADRAYWKETANYLKHNVQPGDMIIAYPPAIGRLKYYYNAYSENTTLSTMFDKNKEYKNVWYITYPLRIKKTIGNNEIYIHKADIGSVHIYKHYFLRRLIYKDDYSNLSYLMESYDVQNISWSKKHNLIFPSNNSASITYKFELEKPIESIVISGLIYAYKPNNNVSIYAGRDGINYTKIGAFEGNLKSNYIQSFGLDATNIVKQSTTVYVKIEMHCVNRWNARLEALKIYEVSTNILKKANIISPSQNGSWNYFDNYSNWSYLMESYDVQNISWSKKHNLIYPSSNTASITYKFELEKPIESIVISGLIYAYKPNNNISIYAGRDGINYTKIGAFEGNLKSNYIQSFSVNATNIVKQSTTVYVKIEMHCVNRLNARLEALKIYGFVERE